MRSEGEYRQVLELIKTGINDCEIGRRLGNPRGTIRDWRVGQRAGAVGRTKSSSSKQVITCFRCTNGLVDEEAYAYLLGVYLGDGCLLLVPRMVYRLRIACDQKYPEIIDEIATCIVIVRGTEKVRFVGREGCVEVYSHWKHWPCVFLQHGPGRKHERRIELAPWQRIMVAADPRSLIRGLIHSDGNRYQRGVQGPSLRHSAPSVSAVHVRERIQ